MNEPKSIKQMHYTIRSKAKQSKNMDRVLSVLHAHCTHINTYIQCNAMQYKTDNSKCVRVEQKQKQQQQKKTARQMQYPSVFVCMRKNETCVFRLKFAKEARERYASWHTKATAKCRLQIWCSTYTDGCESCVRIVRAYTLLSCYLSSRRPTDRPTLTHNIQCYV